MQKCDIITLTSANAGDRDDDGNPSPMSLSCLAYLDNALYDARKWNKRHKRVWRSIRALLGVHVVIVLWKSVKYVFDFFKSTLKFSILFQNSRSAYPNKIVVCHLVLPAENHHLNRYICGCLVRLAIEILAFTPESMF